MKKNIFNVAIAISLIIRKFGLIKGQLWDTIEKIISYLEEVNEENLIKTSIEKLKEFNIDV